MKNFYSMILLMAVVSVNASEKKLRARLEREYDLQLAQKTKEIESRKLLQSVAKKHKNNIRDDRNKNLEIKQQQKSQVQEKLHQLSFLQRYHAEVALLSGVVILPVMFVAFGELMFGIPAGCYANRDVCTCFYL